jgi:hypothetical protein
MPVDSLGEETTNSSFIYGALLKINENQSSSIERE